MSKRIVLSIILILVLALSAAACGNKNSGNNETPVTEAPGDDISQEPDIELPDDANTEEDNDTGNNTDAEAEADGDSDTEDTQYDDSNIEQDTTPDAAPNQSDVGSASNSNEPTEAEIEEAKRIYDEPTIGLKFPLPDVWYKGIYDDENLIISTYDEGMEVSYLTTEGKALLKELLESIENMSGTEEGYSDRQLAIINDLYLHEVFVCMILLEYPGQSDTSDIRDIYSEAVKIGESGDSVYTLLYDKEPDTSMFTGNDAASFKAIYDAMFEIEKTATFTGHSGS